MEVAPTHLLYNRPRHPYTQALLAASPVPDPAQHADAPPLTGDIPSPANPPSGCVFRTRCPHARPLCAEQVPPLVEAAPGHWKACLRDDLPGHIE
jgi:peptide/nickel transport system ATP-binding protein